MQISTRPTIIDDDSQKQIYIHVVSDRFSVKIITSIINNPKTAVEISKETGIPISTVYRRLQYLQENKLLKVSGGINKDGKFFVYQSRIKEIEITFNGQSIRVSITPNLNFTIK
jgi:predicted transcriptional regulator